MVAGRSCCCARVREISISTNDKFPVIFHPRSQILFGNRARGSGARWTSPTGELREKRINALVFETLFRCLGQQSCRDIGIPKQRLGTRREKKGLRTRSK